MLFRVLGVLALCLAGGCATLPEGTQRSEDDPWERYNRSIYKFNDAVDKAVLRPVAKGYDTITPDPVQRSVTNFFNNLSYPVVALNQFLQGKFLDGGKDFGRFLINTTVGFGGIFDPATEMGLSANNEDFGQTFAVWGLPSGPYFVLPFLGPSTIRDSVGLAVSTEFDAQYEVINKPERYYLIALNVINQRAQFLTLDEQLQETFDPYTFMRDAYLQRREYLIYDGNPPQDEYYDDLYDFEEEYPDEAATDSIEEINIPEDTGEDSAPELDGAGNSSQN